MTQREQTVQQLDPLAGVNGRLVTVFGSVALVGYAIVMTIFNRHDVDIPVLAIAALVALGAGAIIVGVASSPLRPPVNRTVHVVALSLALLAMVLSAMSMFQSNAFIQDDWGTIAVGAMCLILCPYRPPREQVIAIVLATIFAGFVVLLQAQSLVTGIPVFATIVVALTPLLCMALAGVAFASIVLRMLRRWQSRATRAMRALAEEHREGITRSVQQDRVTILNRDVVPFFTAVLGQDQLTDADRARALEISNSIRASMVADVDRTWLDVVVSQASKGALADAVVDRGRVANAMSTDQRTAMRALLVAILSHPGVERDGFSIVITDAGSRADGVIRATFSPAEPARRAAFAPYLAIFLVVFLDLQVDLAASSLTVRFSYDQR